MWKHRCEDIYSKGIDQKNCSDNNLYLHMINTFLLGNNETLRYDDLVTHVTAGRNIFTATTWKTLLVL